MNRIDLTKLDRRTVFGIGLGVFSVVILVAGLFGVVSALTADDVQLPEEGSIENILGSADGGEQVSGASEGIPDPPPGPSPVRMSVPQIYIDAPVITMGLIPDTNTPEVPDRPDQVAWYNFSATAGVGNNAVFTGHVDWQTRTGAPIPGVFYRLRELRIGDEITVTREDGSVLAYRVTGNVATAYDDPNVSRAMGRTSRDVLTLITCGGSWIKDPSKENGGNYSHRIIVRAERVEEVPAAAAVGE